MAITDDLELPITFVPITGPGVDRFNDRKENGSPICLEDEVNKRLRSYIGSERFKANNAALKLLCQSDA